MGKLTDVAIRAWIKAGERFEGRTDGGGLVLTWRPDRTAPHWRLRYRFAGKSRVMNLRSYTDLPLAAALKSNARCLDDGFEELVSDLALLVRRELDVGPQKVNEAAHCRQDGLNLALRQQATELFTLLLQLSVQCLELVVVKSSAAYQVVCQQLLMHPIGRDSVDLSISERSQTLSRASGTLSGLDRQGALFASELVVDARQFCGEKPLALIHITRAQGVGDVGLAARVGSLELGRDADVAAELASSAACV